MGHTLSPVGTGRYARAMDEDTKIHKKEMAAVVGTSAVMAKLSVTRGLNDLRLAALALLLTFASTLGVGLGDSWWSKLGISGLVFAATVVLLAWPSFRGLVEALMFRVVGI
jgi:hypothetical protein